MILILTNKKDVSADYVVRELRNRDQNVLRLNVETMPDIESTIEIPGVSYILRTKIGRYDLAKKLKSVWFRRPGRFLENESRASPELDYVHSQWNAFIEGIQCIKGVSWINSPFNNRLAENKIRQLSIAEEVGFKVPRTCITSSKDKALEFSEHYGGVVVAKALNSPLIESPEKDYFIFSNCVQLSQNIGEDEIRICPTIFQERIYPKVDYRITVVGNQCFPVKIELPKYYSETDWRLIKENARFTNWVDAPSDLCKRSIRITKELGLVFGAIDIVESEEGFYFLEINPNGEWGWLQKEGIPIAESIVDALVNANGQVEK